MFTPRDLRSLSNLADACGLASLRHAASASLPLGIFERLEPRGCEWQPLRSLAVIRSGKHFDDASGWTAGAEYPYIAVPLIAPTRRERKIYHFPP